MLSGGTMILGALWGRVSSTEDDDLVRDLACQFRERFIGFAGSSQCEQVRDQQPEQPKRCLPVVLEGTKILVELIEQAAKVMPFKGD